jgi:hypothetical protein
MSLVHDDLDVDALENGLQRVREPHPRRRNSLEQARQAYALAIRQIAEGALIANAPLS